jgi:hypothetical protein
VRQHGLGSEGVERPPRQRDRSRGEEHLARQHGTDERDAGAAAQRGKGAMRAMGAANEL